MSLTLNLDDEKVIKKVENDKFGRLVSHEWHRLINPYTPRDTGALMGAVGQTVDELPFALHYKETYAERVYYGEDMNFQKKNPYATYQWDVAAANAGQMDKLYRTLNAALESGKI